MECERLELLKVVYHFASQRTVVPFSSVGSVNDDRRSLCLDALHHTLNGGLAEVVGVRTSWSSDTHQRTILCSLLALILCCVAIVPAIWSTRSAMKSLRVRLDSTIASMRFSGTSCVVGEQLLGVLGQAVAAVTEARVVVMRRRCAGRGTRPR